MTPNLRKDPDFKRFQAELQDTVAGTDFRRAWNDMHRAIKLMRMPSFDGNGPRFLDAKIDHYRREYIKASDRASEAIDSLSARYAWPTDSQTAHFIWKPTGQARRQRRSEL